jgi:hypothetical protein
MRNRNRMRMRSAEYAQTYFSKVQSIGLSQFPHFVSLSDSVSNIVEDLRNVVAFVHRTFAQPCALVQRTLAKQFALAQPCALVQRTLAKPFALVEDYSKNPA